MIQVISKDKDGSMVNLNIELSSKVVTNEAMAPVFGTTLLITPNTDCCRSAFAVNWFS